MSYFLTTQTGFSALPLDCLKEIFQYLENDMTSLYRCMLVNRTWCRINISLLWRRPFEYFGSESTRRYPELIRTYIACLSSNAKTEICKAGYHISDRKRPLFPYHEYLKELDCQKLDEAAGDWTKKFYNRLKNDYEDVVYRELLRLLLSRSKGLWRLRLGQYKEKYNLPPIGTFPCIEGTLANLRRFEFLGETDRLSDLVLDNIYQFLRKLSVISKKLEYINVDMTEDRESYSGDGLRDLIASQKNLSFFRYNQEKPHSIHSSKKFFKALSHNANTLKNIEFNSIPLDEQCLCPLKNFSNLECIQFAYCYEMNEKDDGPTEDDKIVEHSPSQLKVEKLIFHRGDLKSVTLEVLRLVNTSVKELTVYNVVLNLFECIFNNCPNITYLATAISPNTIESLACLSSSKIEHLILRTFQIEGTTENFETKDFQQLGKSLFLSLRHLSLHFNVSVEELSSLLNECQSPLESLCLKFNITADSNLNKDEYLKAVMEFAKKNDSLKEFKFFLEFKDTEIKDDFDIFSKDILADAKLLIPNISRETQDPFAYIDINSKVSLSI